MSKIESSIARMRHLQAIPVHYDMGDRNGNDADGDGRIEFDCSSAVSYALEINLNNNTETLQRVLPTIGYSGRFSTRLDGTFDGRRWGRGDLGSARRDQALSDHRPYLDYDVRKLPQSIAITAWTA